MMSVIVINQVQVTELLPMNECIAVVARAFEEFAHGHATQPLRPVLPLSGGSVLVMMPASSVDIGAAGAKVFTVYPDEVTLFKSVGLGIQDLAAANYIFRRAEAQGVGVQLEIGGRHHAMGGSE